MRIAKKTILIITRFLVVIDSADATETKRMMADIDKDSRLVVYCQSSGCQFAEKVSIRLKEAGYGNISIFKGGWMEWEKEGR